MTRIVRITLATLGVAALATTATAQGILSRTTFGLYGGMNYTTVQGSNVSGADYRSGFVGGAFLLWKMNDVIGIQPEVQFSQEGAKFTDNSLATPRTADLRVDYVQIPVLVRARLTDESRDASLHLLAGPFVSFKAGCSSSTAGVSVGCAGSTVNTTDYGVMAGFGVDFRVARQLLTLSPRYHLGIPDLVKGNFSNNNNSGFSFVLGARW